MKNETKHSFETDFKLKWLGYGEWIEEPDVITFSYKGIKCMVYRVIKREPYCPQEAYFGGHLCGYIVLPKSHPFCEKKPGDIDLEVHGGITWAEPCEEGLMIGFDCGHSCDFIPTMEQMRKRREAEGWENPFPVPEEFKKYLIFNPEYRNVKYCIKECKNMVNQALKVTA